MRPQTLVCECVCVCVCVCVCTLQGGLAVQGVSGEEEEEEGDGYFSTYSHYSIHHEMLSDRVRTEAYQNFITKNPTLFKDKAGIPYHCYYTHAILYIAGGVGHRLWYWYPIIVCCSMRG